MNKEIAPLLPTIEEKDASLKDGESWNSETNEIVCWQISIKTANASQNGIANGKSPSCLGYGSDLPVIDLEKVAKDQSRRCWKSAVPRATCLSKLADADGNDIDQFCAKLFPIVFFAFNVIYWWFYTLR